MKSNTLRPRRRRYPRWIHARCSRYPSALPMLVPGVFACHVYDVLPAYHLALFAKRLDTRPYLQKFLLLAPLLLPEPISDTSPIAFTQIGFFLEPVARPDADEVIRLLPGTKRVQSSPVIYPAHRSLSISDPPRYPLWPRDAANSSVASPPRVSRVRLLSGPHL